VTLTLALEEPSRGVVRGTLTSSSGTILALEGLVEDGVAHGTADGAGSRAIFEAELEGARLVLTFMEVGPSGVTGARSLAFTRGGAAPSAGPKAPAATPAPERKGSAGKAPAVTPAEPSGDRDLLGYFAGRYYSFASGSTTTGGAATERRLTLCPDGTYEDSAEGSASGTGWGQAVQQGDRGRWRMEGNRERGTLFLAGAGGQVRRLAYQADRREQTLRVGGTLFAFEGAARCR
jgi:hypothetical protein